MRKTRTHLVGIVNGEVIGSLTPPLRPARLLKAMMAALMHGQQTIAVNYLAFAGGLPGEAVAFSRNFTSALRSSAEPILCSGILVPGV